MEESTTKALEQISAKLGTTTEYLWSVLIKQAPIDSIITLTQGLVILLLSIGLWKAHQKLMKKPDDFNDNYYDKHEVLAVMPMIIMLVFLCTTIIMWICCIGDIVNGFINPEYWALHKVMSILK